MLISLLITKSPRRVIGRYTFSPRYSTEISFPWVDAPGLNNACRRRYTPVPLQDRSSNSLMIVCYIILFYIKLRFLIMVLMFCYLFNSCSFIPYNGCYGSCLSSCTGGCLLTCMLSTGCAASVFRFFVFVLTFLSACGFYYLI